MARAPTVDLSVSREEVLSCAISAWYERFKSVTFESLFIPLSPDFVAYLNKDGVILPHGCPLPSHVKPQLSDSESDSEEEKEDWSDSDSDHSEGDTEPYFPELVERIQSAIASLGGCVVPKLNWSTPRDATWMLPGNSLGCTTVGEIILLLKSSDFIAHDLSRVFEYCGDEAASAAQSSITYTLCLRRWVNFHPSAEFRCFVRDSNLIAISQREYTSCYDFLVAHKDSIREEIVAFFHRSILGKFRSKNYVFDVCRVNEGDIRLVDFNPFCPMTDGLLFSWSELVRGNLHNEGEAPVIRVVEGKPGVQPHDLHTSRLPKDFVDLSTGADIEKFVDFVKMNKLDKDSGSDSEPS